MGTAWSSMRPLMKLASEPAASFVAAASLEMLSCCMSSSRTLTVDIFAFVEGVLSRKKETCRGYRSSMLYCLFEKSPFYNAIPVKRVESQGWSGLNKGNLSPGGE